MGIFGMRDRRGQGKETKGNVVLKSSLRISVIFVRG